MEHSVAFAQDSSLTQESLSEPIDIYKQLELRYGRKLNFFFSQFPFYQKVFIINILQGPHIQGKVNTKIYFAIKNPETFCKNELSQLRLAAWLSIAKEKELEKYANFINNFSLDSISVESFINAKRLIIQEAKYRHIFIPMDK